MILTGRVTVQCENIEEYTEVRANVVALPEWNLVSSSESTLKVVTDWNLNAPYVPSTPE